jgi:hypothetical protein
MRQAEGNPIIKYCDTIRKKLHVPRPTNLDKDTFIGPAEGLMFIDNKPDFMGLLDEWFLSGSYEDDSDYAKVIAYTNKTVDAINQYVRISTGKRLKTLLFL